MDISGHKLFSVYSKASKDIPSLFKLEWLIAEKSKQNILKCTNAANSWIFVSYVINLNSRLEHILFTLQHCF